MKCYAVLCCVECAFNLPHVPQLHNNPYLKCTTWTDIRTYSYDGYVPDDVQILFQFLTLNCKRPEQAIAQWAYKEWFSYMDLKRDIDYKQNLINFSVGKKQPHLLVIFYHHLAITIGSAI